MYMSIINVKQIALSLLILLVLLIPFISYNNGDTVAVSEHQSVELGVSSFSPSGERGGAVIPASCGSPHSGDLCTSPTFDGTSGSSGGGSGSNISVNTGDSATLSWTCDSSSSSSGVNFSTGGATAGSANVTPSSDTTYTLICSNGGQGSVVVSVINPSLSISATPTLLQSGSTSVISWTATSVNSCAVSEDNQNITDSWTGTSGTETSSALTEETVYVLSCETDAGSVSDNVTIRLVPIFQEF